MRQKGHALRRRYGRARAAGGPMGNFRTAARKVERMIEELRVGGGDLNEPFHDASYRVAQAINKLEDRCTKPEIRGDDALRDEAWATCSRLRAAKREADEIGLKARQDRRSQEIAKIRERERERFDNMSPREREAYYYQQELLKGRIR